MFSVAREASFSKFTIENKAFHVFSDSPGVSQARSPRLSFSPIHSTNLKVSSHFEIPTSRLKHTSSIEPVASSPISAGISMSVHQKGSHKGKFHPTFSGLSASVGNKESKNTEESENTSQMIFLDNVIIVVVSDKDFKMTAQYFDIFSYFRKNHSKVSSASLFTSSGSF